MLDNNDSYTAIKKLTGFIGYRATGTNVADLQVLLIYLIYTNTQLNQEPQCLNLCP